MANNSRVCTLQVLYPPGVYRGARQAPLGTITLPGEEQETGISVRAVLLYDPIFQNELTRL